MSLGIRTKELDAALLWATHPFPFFYFFLFSPEACFLNFRKRSEGRRKKEESYVARDVISIREELLVFDRRQRRFFLCEI